MQTQWPPGSKQPPFVQLIDYVLHPYEFMDRQQRAHGDVFTVNLPGLGRHVVVASPAGLRELTTGSSDVIERFAGILRFFLGRHSVIFQEGLPHRRMRKALTPT